MAREWWTPAEDRRPGVQLLPKQPERTARGRVWTQIVVFPWPAPGYTQMTIRECRGQYWLGHGRVYPVIAPAEEDDQA